MPLPVCIIAFQFLNLCLFYSITLARGARSAWGWASRVSRWYSLDPISFVLLGFPPDFQGFCLPLKQQHCSSWETLEWFEPVPLFMTLGICWPRSNVSCRALALSRHRPLRAVAGHPRFSRAWTPFLGSIFPLYNNPQVLTFLNKSSEEKETAWRETTEPAVGLGDRRKSPLCNSELLSFSWHCTGHTNPWQAGAKWIFLSILLLILPLPLQHRQSENQITEIALWEQIHQ